MYGVSLVAFYFFIYAFLGWIAELLYTLIVDRRLINPGFLQLPFVPIYGFASIIIVFLLTPFIDNPFVVFVLSVILTTILEYFTHLMLEKFFHVALWNYTDRRFNIHGRVALDMSLGFGALALLLVYVIHPLSSSLVQLLPEIIVMLAAVVLTIAALFDAFNVASSLTRIRLSNVIGKLNEFQSFAESQLAQLMENTGKRRPLRRLLLRLDAHNVRRLQRDYPSAHLVTSKKQKNL